MNRTSSPASSLGRVSVPRIVLTALLLGTAASVMVLAQEAATSSPPPPITEGATQMVQNGAEVFAQSCSVCHGATGLGLAEAKQAFPQDHRLCHRCHKRGNPPTMTLAQIEARQHDLFDVGDPPPLRGDGALAGHAPRPALQAYLEAAMPRYRPGTLSDEEYRAVTEFLLHLNGRR